MNCVKCGKKTEGTDVFCPECLEEMKQYPVKPGIKIQIPVRPEPAERKPVKTKKEKTPEEQIAALQKLVKLLTVLLVTLSATLAIAVGILAFQLSSDTDQQPQQPMSRNYTTSDITDGS